MTTQTPDPDRQALALRVFEAAICDPSDHLGDALSRWLGIAEDSARCLAEHADTAVRTDTQDQLSLGAAAGVAEAIHRSVKIARLLGVALHREAITAEKQARVSI